jgi:uncharacterized membrane protein YedE/YeeE
MIESITMATAGGVLIGLAASLLLLANGRIAGISGIVGELFKRTSPDSSWRALFVIGLLTGGGVLLVVAPEVIAAPESRSLAAVGTAGLLVGVGTRLGSGCTSGHGVCGLSRFSTRSLVATLSFMATGFATASLVQLLFGGTL